MLQTASSARSCNDWHKQFSTTGNGKRISTISWNGKRIWIKCPVHQKPSFRRRLRSAISFILPMPYLRTALSGTPEEMTRREVEKTAAFRAANIPVPDIIGAWGPVLVLSDTGSSIQESLDRLRSANAHLHDSLLIQCAETLGAVHAAGLCHGSPGLDDMFLSNGRAGFCDFREYPETVMPLPMAQARDLWLLFSQIMAQALEKHRTANAAFTAWRRHISLETLESLRRLVHFFGILTGPLRLARPICLGVKGKRMLCTTDFLIAHLGL